MLAIAKPSLDAHDRVLCLCPTARLSAASLILSTWTNVRHVVLTDDVAAVDRVGDFSAVVLMDAFVDAIAERAPVFVFAWNGQFEIHEYVARLGPRSVVYVGTDEALDCDRPYVPLINAQCSFATWRALVRSKSQFEVHGSVRYRLRWARTRLMPVRSLNVAIATAGAYRHAEIARDTWASAFVREKLVWAGNCYIDRNIVGLDTQAHRDLVDRIETLTQLTSADDRLIRGLELAKEWHTNTFDHPEHQAFYLANTLLRWSVLGFLKATNPQSTWFFGRDNVGLGLPHELYVHNLVPPRGTVFLDFGGKTSESTIYPRFLQLMEREYYVIGLDLDTAAITSERIRRALDRNSTGFFATLERRRHDLYRSGDATLGQVQKRVWRDFGDAGAW
jgi:hypothetical protein